MGGGWGGEAMFLFSLVYVGFGVSIVYVGSLLLACVSLVVRGRDWRRVCLFICGWLW